MTPREISVRKSGFISAGVLDRHRPAEVLNVASQLKVAMQPLMEVVAPQPGKPHVVRLQKACELEKAAFEAKIRAKREALSED